MLLLLYVCYTGCQSMFPMSKHKTITAILTYDQAHVRTATRSTLKMVANLTQILNFKAHFLQEFKLFSINKIYANNGGHFKIVSIIKKIKFVHIRPYNFKKYLVNEFHSQLSSRARESLSKQEI